MDLGGNNYADDRSTYVDRQGNCKSGGKRYRNAANTMQIFSRNPRGSSYKDYSRAEVDKFQTLRKDHEFGALLAHAPYTMNLASPKPETYELPVP